MDTSIFEARSINVFVTIYQCIVQVHLFKIVSCRYTLSKMKSERDYGFYGLLIYIDSCLQIIVDLGIKIS